VAHVPGLSNWSEPDLLGFAKLVAQFTPGFAAPPERNGRLLGLSDVALRLGQCGWCPPIEKGLGSLPSRELQLPGRD